MNRQQCLEVLEFSEEDAAASEAFIGKSIEYMTVADHELCARVLMAAREALVRANNARALDSLATNSLIFQLAADFRDIFRAEPERVAQ